MPPANKQTIVPAFRFFHGLGDCCNAAYLLSLWTKRGLVITVHCEPDKAILFRAAGCQVVERAGRAHTWLHAPSMSRGCTFQAPWLVNKTAHNLIHELLPNIGDRNTLWRELCRVQLTLNGSVPETVWQDIERRLQALPRPILVLHSRGTTGAERKNFPAAVETEFYRYFLDRLPGTLVLLDWHGRIEPPPDTGRILTGQQLGGLALLQLCSLLQQADLLIGVDSGPLHLARFTNLDTVGCWFGHRPEWFALPRPTAVHLTATGPLATSRHAYHIVDVPSMTGAAIGRMVDNVLAKRKWLRACGPDLTLQRLLDQLSHQQGHLQPHVDRGDIARVLLAHLKPLSDPIVVETGCIRSPDDWGAGYFGYWMGYFLSQHGGQLHSVDNTPKNAAFARDVCRDMPVKVHVADSVTWLQRYRGSLDLLYLDSLDTTHPQHAEHALREAQAGWEKLSPGGLLVIDDTISRDGQVVGKGRLAVPWLLEQGARLVRQGYQTVLKK